MVERQSALAGHDRPETRGPIGPEGARILLSERRIASLWQIAAWGDRMPAAGAAAAAAAGVEAAPGPGRSVTGPGGTLMRTEPLKWLLLSETPIARPALEPGDGVTLDLSHARTVIHVAGTAAPELMARLVPIDTRPRSFPEGSVATAPMHHVAVTVLARGGGYDLVCIRSFGLSAWEHLIEVAAQFGVETR